MRKRILSLDIIRVFAIWMIVMFHFCGTFGLTDSFFYIYKNGSWGAVGTTIFFVLSGFLMRLCNQKIISLKTFYKKRALSIYPLLIVTFLGAYVIQSIYKRDFFYGGSPWKIFLSLLGVDGYLAFYGIPTYYIVGEWFTAVIVLLYACYPLLNLLYEKSIWLGTVFFAGLYVGNLIWGFQKIIPDASVFTAFFLFWIGMIFQKYAEKFLRYPVVLAGSGILSLMITFAELPIHTLLCQNLLGIMLFIFLFAAFEGINNWKQDSLHTRILVFLSESSFAVYLSHHFIMNKIAGALRMVGNADIKLEAIFVVTICVVMVVSVVLYRINNYINK